MSLNDTPSGERVQIAFFGLRNAGKSSLVNAVTGQDLAVVSDTAGTTTDPVRKAMELLPVGPVVIIDTPGIDDVGELGELRVQKAREVLRRCDVAVLVTEAGRALKEPESGLVALFEERHVPYVIALNKADLLTNASDANPEGRDHTLVVSALEGMGIHELKEKIASAAHVRGEERWLIADLLSPGDMVVFVVPIDSAAPKGRLILPQQMAIRDVLDAHCACSVCQVGELAATLEALVRPPRMVVTDSQAFAEVAHIVPADVPLTSFSMLMARYKADLPTLVEGAKALAGLTDDSRVLIAEGCTHHRQCDDIGSVKMPGWIRAHCGADPSFEFCSGGTFPDDLGPYDVVVHCGDCMLNRREMESRVERARNQDTPIVNYGVAIACMHGILSRCLSPFSTE